MGEKVEGAKNEGGEKKGPVDAGKKVDDGSNVVVFKTDMHCEGCARKIKRAVKNFPGVEQVKTDAAANKLTVTGKVDPAALKARLEEKIKRKVDLVSQPAKKEGGGGGDKKPDEKPSEKKPEDKKSPGKKSEEKKPADNKSKDKEVAAPKGSTVNLKIRLHCEGCIRKMRSKILKFKGVSTVSFDMAKDLVTVVGTMDTKALVPFLSEKFMRPVDVIAPAKKDDVAGIKKDDKKPAAEGSDKKKDAGGDNKKEGKKEEKNKASAAEKKEEKKEAAASSGVAVVNKMEYSGYPYAAAASTSYWYDPGHVYNHNKFVTDAQEHQAYVNHGYGHYAMPMEHYPPAPQMFSEENPNGCSVM